MLSLSSHYPRERHTQVLGAFQAKVVLTFTNLDWILDVPTPGNCPVWNGAVATPVLSQRAGAGGWPAPAKAWPPQDAPGLPPSRHSASVVPAVTSPDLSTFVLPQPVSRMLPPPAPWHMQRNHLSSGPAMAGAQAARQGTWHFSACSSIQLTDHCQLPRC